MLGAVGRASGRAGCPSPIAAYVELIRNTPLLIQLYIVFFSLPLIGLNSRAARRRSSRCRSISAPMRPRSCGPASNSIPAGPDRGGQVARALGPTASSAIVVLVPAVRAVYPSLSAQFILQLMGTSIVGDRGRGADRDRQQSGHADVPQLRGLHRRGRHLFRRRAGGEPAVPASAGGLFRGSDEPVREFGPNELVPAAGGALDDPARPDRLRRRRRARAGVAALRVAPAGRCAGWRPATSSSSWARRC